MDISAKSCHGERSHHRAEAGMSPIDIHNLDFDRLSTADCAMLIGALADRLQMTAEPATTRETLDELNRRRERFRADPSSAQPWDEVRRDVFGR
jgi:putative addiction module component (TIGR02574 family)